MGSCVNVSTIFLHKFLFPAFLCTSLHVMLRFSNFCCTVLHVLTGLRFFPSMERESIVHVLRCCCSVFKECVQPMLFWSSSPVICHSVVHLVFFPAKKYYADYSQTFIYDENLYFLYLRFINCSVSDPYNKVGFTFDPKFFSFVFLVMFVKDQILFGILKALLVSSILRFISCCEPPSQLICCQDSNYATGQTTCFSKRQKFEYTAYW